MQVGRCLGAIRAGRDHADAGSGLLLDEVQIVLRELCGSLSNSVMPSVETVPAFERGVDGLIDSKPRMSAGILSVTLPSIS